jgi:hypothetical protein
METPAEVIYQPWPIEVIREAWEQFRDIMYDGAGPEELAAGLHGMDFLMRASEIPEPMLCMIDATLDGARIRIGLMREKEAAERTEAENWEHIKRGLEILRMNIKSINKLIDSYRDSDPNYVRARIRENIEYRRSNG